MKSRSLEIQEGIAVARVRTTIFFLPAAAAVCAVAAAAVPVNPRALDRRWAHLQCDLSKDSGFDAATNRISVAAAHGYTGVMFAHDVQLTSLYRWGEERKARLGRVVALCDRLGLEKGVVLWGPGYPKQSFFPVDPNLSAANPVFGTRYRVEGGKCVYLPHPATRLVESPAPIHSPRQEGDFVKTSVKVSPKRSYRIAAKLRAECPHKSWPVALFVRRAGEKGAAMIEHRVFGVKTTGETQTFTLDFPSMALGEVEICCVGNNSNFPGRAEILSMELSEMPPVVAVRRHGTPIAVRDAKTGISYEEGRDYAKIPKAEDVWPGDWIPEWKRFAVKPLPGGRMKDGTEIEVDCYCPFPVWGRWQGACMGAVEMDGIIAQSAAAVAATVNPKTWLLGMDEVRTGGGCEDCLAIGDCAHVYAAFAKKCMAAVRRVKPDAEFFIWNDMVDPYCLSNESRKGNYAALYSTMKGVWDFLPRDLGIACWREDFRGKGMAFFSKRGRKILSACYYDAKDLKSSVEWAEKALETPGADGIMYCTWCDRWNLLGAWGDEMKRRAEGEK